MITNPKRKKRLQEFIDKDHTVMGEYYDLLDSEITNKQMKEEMKELIKQDPNFYDPYVILSNIEFVSGNIEEGSALVKEAFERAVARIADSKGDWPVTMRWGFLENRHLMRALEQWAVLLWNIGDTEAALDIFRRLLRANPDDNQGARSSILALRMGLGTNWYKSFEVKDGPMAGEAIDAITEGKWFDENSKKFPEEFDWLFKIWKKEGYFD